MEPTIDNELELIKHATSVHAKDIQKQITSDFIYAKIPEEIKQGIIEVGDHAYYIQRLYEQMTKDIKMWKWNKETKNWEERETTEKENKKLEKLKERVFDSYMTKLKIIAILNRNVKENPILTFIKKEPMEEEKTDEKMIEKIGNYRGKKK